MNNIFIDGGTHFGQGLNHFVNRFGMNDSWKIITFEANPITYELHSKNRQYDFVDYKNQAIYIFDGEYDNERYKDYDLLVTTTAIALGAYVLDKILNSYPKDEKKVAN
jgi:hypothetical protein